METPGTIDAPQEKPSFPLYSGIEDSQLSSLDICAQMRDFVAPATYPIVQDHIRSLIISHSQLRHLSIVISKLVPDHLFEALSLPLLRSFCFGVTVDELDFDLPDWTDADMFLANHPTLEEVRIDDYVSWDFRDEDQCRGRLPNLILFSALPLDVFPLMKELPSGEYRPLRWLRVEGPEHALTVSSLRPLREMGTLITLDLVCEPREVLVALEDLPCLRSLQTLSVSLDGPDSSNLLNLQYDTGLPEVTEYITAGFPSLRCLKGFFSGASLCLIFKFNKDILLDSPSAYKRVLRSLSEACPTLELVDNWRRKEGSSSSWELDGEEQQQILLPPFDVPWQDSYGIPGSSRAVKRACSGARSP